MDSRAFYDDFVDRQVATGVNARHRSILGWMRRFGLVDGAAVLEIGSGIGTLTGLLAEAVGTAGRVVAVDLSPRSVEVARERLGHLGQVELRVGDALELGLDDRFDAVVLPDVLEHIPLDDHPALFGRLSAALRPGGFLLAHYPDPVYLEWLREHRPELLQAIDQPVHADALAAAAYPHGLLLRHLETYPVWVREGDYQVALFVPRPERPEFTDLPSNPPPWRRLGERLRRVVRTLLGRAE